MLQLFFGSHYIATVLVEEKGVVSQPWNGYCTTSVTENSSFVAAKQISTFSSYFQVFVAKRSLSAWGDLPLWLKCSRSRQSRVLKKTSPLVHITALPERKREPSKNPTLLNALIGDKVLPQGLQIQRGAFLFSISDFHYVEEKAKSFMGVRSPPCI